MVRTRRFVSAMLILGAYFWQCAANAETNSDVKTYYEEFHRHPELGKVEFKTSEYIKTKLKDFGYTNIQSIKAVPTTVIAILDTAKPGPTICFRAEMDARKCQESSGVSYSSEIAGTMHNCGHDAHSAILLDTAHRLMKSKESLSGKIVFLFQPAEECPGGADDIVNDGILNRLGVQAIFAQHCAPGVAAGAHLLKAGAVMAGSNTLNINLQGKGGHAAQVHERDDLIGLASIITLELERLPSRCVDPIQYPTVCTITKIEGSSEQTNVAADNVTLTGTIRAFYNIDDKLFRRKSFRELCNQLVDGFALAYGVEAKTNIKQGAPVTSNDVKLCKAVESALKNAGIQIEDSDRSMFSEDFAYYTSSITCAYFGLGIAKESQGIENLHSATFNINEDCLDSGVVLFETIAKNSTKLGR
ncbi:MAG: amidohydrolase [Candidatus Obscuribacterales bacterium]|nr:amidohydrolase [Candidatus Obscuribacterales bacterium]